MHADEDERIALVRRQLDAWNRGDVEGVLEGMRPDFEFFPLRALLHGEGYVGHDGFRRFAEDMKEEWDRFRIQPETFHFRGDRLVMIALLEARGRASGVEIEQRVGYLFQFEGDEVACLRTLPTEEEARAAAGLE